MVRDAVAAYPERRREVYLPFLIYALTLAILIYAPLHKIALQQNFDWHRDDRERIVARVEAGELKPNVANNKSLIALGGREPTFPLAATTSSSMKPTKAPMCCF